MVRLRAGGGIRVSHEARRAYHARMNASRTLLLAAFVALSASPVSAQEGWALAGQQGLVRFVIVPAAQAADAAAYQREIARLCEPERTCFLNFYTNSRGVPVTLPLPDAIEAEATATFRRSMKNGAERFLWSCRMKMPQQECF